MEKECPKCGTIMCGEIPNHPTYVVYVCEECGYEEGEDITGDLIDQAMLQKEDEKIPKTLEIKDETSKD